MGRIVEKIVFAALILLPGTGLAADRSPVAAPSKPAPSTAASPAAGTGKGAVRLDEVRISGAPEHPGVLFFLPRARFRLLPLQAGGDGVDPIPGEDRGKGAPDR